MGSKCILLTKKNMCSNMEQNYEIFCKYVAEKSSQSAKIIMEINLLERTTFIVDI